MAKHRRGTKLAAICLILLVIVQVPFTVMVLALFVGLSQHGPEYLLQVYDTMVIMDLAEKRDPDKHRRPEIAEPVETAEANQRIEPAEEPDPIEELAPRREEPERLERRIADLPTHYHLSKMARSFWGVPDLVVDYVSLPESLSRYADNDRPVQIRMRPLAGPRVLILVGQPGLSWSLGPALPDQLLGVVVVAAKGDTAARLVGLPESIPAERLDLTRKKLPFLLSAVPDCAVGADRGRHFKCSNVKRDEETGRYRSAFEVADETVRDLLRGPIATVSAAYADDQDRLILVPEEIVDDAVRDQAREYVKRYAEALDEEKRARVVRKEYKNRWIEDRRLDAINEIARHPQFVLDEITDRTPNVIIVSAYEGTSTATRKSKKQPARTYEEYEKQQAATVGSIVVRVKTRKPTVIVATANRAVDWIFDVAGDTDLLAVQVEGALSPSVSGVPDNLPLKVLSRAYGDRKAAAQLRRLPEDAPDTGENRQIRTALARIHASYRGSSVYLVGDYRLQEMTIVDPSDGGQVLGQ